jgi:hypothetical protein
MTGVAGVVPYGQAGRVLVAASGALLVSGLPKAPSRRTA